MAYNRYAHDVNLPGSTRANHWRASCTHTAEASEGRIDPFDPDDFKYEITAKEIG